MNIKVIKFLKRNKKVLIIFLCVLFVLSMVATTIVSGDLHHIEVCKLDHCLTCDLIHNAICIISNIIYLFVFFYLLGIVIPLLYLIKKKVYKFKRNNLIECKIQKNE